MIFAVPIAIYILSLPLPYLPEGTSLSPFFGCAILLCVCGLYLYNTTQPANHSSKADWKRPFMKSMLKRYYQLGTLSHWECQPYGIVVTVKYICFPTSPILQLYLVNKITIIIFGFWLEGRKSTQFRLFSATLLLYALTLM